MFRLSQLYRHPKVSSGPTDIRTARSKAVFLGRQPFNAVPTPSTAQVGILVLPPWILYSTVLLLSLFSFTVMPLLNLSAICLENYLS